jgi:hypothetical protein
MASPAQIAANQLNSRKSTGPTTPIGRARSSMNALKHGNCSRKLALRREESRAFEDRLRKWMAIEDAQNDVEEFLTYRNVALSFESGAGHYDRLEPLCVIDPDGVDQPGDLLSGMGEIGQNAANEANFDESTSIVEVHDSVQVTANSDGFSGPGSKTPFFG